MVNWWFFYRTANVNEIEIKTKKTPRHKIRFILPVDTFCTDICDRHHSITLTKSSLHLSAEEPRVVSKIGCAYSLVSYYLKLPVRIQKQSYTSEPFGLLE